MNKNLIIDNNAVISEQIAPKVEEIKKICAMYNIPFFFSVLAEDDGENSKYISEIISPSVTGVHATNDRITPLLNVMNGFDTVAPIHEVTFDF